MNNILPDNGRAIEQRREQQDSNSQRSDKNIDASTRAEIEQSIRKVDDPNTREALNLLLDAVDG